MANAFYDLGRQAVIEGGIAFLSANMKITSIDETDDVPILATDEFLDAIGAGAREFQSGNLASKTTAAGVYDAANLAPAFTGAAGDQFESITLYRDSGAAATSELLLNIDTASGLPLSPDGGNIDITWSDGGNRIAKI